MRILSLKVSSAMCLVVALLTAGLITPGDAFSAQRKPQPSKRAASGRSDRDSALRARAASLHRQSIVIDTHNDITSPLLDDGFDLAMRGDDPKAKTKT